jgi:tRNA nucleotidyltransferase/poly(A) polymerase
LTSASQSPADLNISNTDWFREPHLHAVFSSLNRKGHQARIVGGALRNTLMGLAVSDVDFATTATPEEVMQLATDAGLKPVPTGIDHGTITIVADHVPFEVTTLRHDVETHGRRATVSFTRDWEADAARRDFTINALYADCEGRIYDPLGGLPDLHARRVRFIGSARDRIVEDYLRILRFFRFSADYSAGPLDSEGLHACIRHRGGLAGLSAERIRMELLRILVTRNPMLALEPMAESGLLISVLAGVVRLSHFQRVTAVEAELGLTATPIRRLAALALMVEEDCERLSLRLRLSNAQAAKLKAMAALESEMRSEPNEKTARIALYRLGAEDYRDRLLVAWSRRANEPWTEGWNDLLSLAERWTPPVFPVKGQDLIRAGRTPGPDVGKTLRKLEDHWIASDFALSRDDLLKDLTR